jgi:type II secretory pathway pseudopilin PulG
MINKLKTKGFTIVEILASALILSGIIVCIIVYAADALSASIEVERRTKSVLLGEGEMEKIKNTLYQSFGTDFTIWPVNLGSNYLITRTLSDVSTTLKIIGVSVGYDKDKNGSLGTEEIMTTFKTQYAKRN